MLKKKNSKTDTVPKLYAGVSALNGAHRAAEDSEMSRQTHTTTLL